MKHTLVVGWRLSLYHKKTTKKQIDDEFFDSNIKRNTNLFRQSRHRQQFSFILPLLIQEDLDEDDRLYDAFLAATRTYLHTHIRTGMCAFSDERNLLGKRFFTHTRNILYAYSGTIYAVSYTHLTLPTIYSV